MEFTKEQQEFLKKHFEIDIYDEEEYGYYESCCAEDDMNHFMRIFNFKLEQLSDPELMKISYRKYAGYEDE